jgi:hypothetical protein
MMETGVRILITGRVHTGTRPAVSLDQRSVAKGMIGMTKTCTMSSAIEMHMARSKIGAKSENASSRSDATRVAIVIMVLSITNLTDNAPLKEGIMQEESKPFLTT